MIGIGEALILLLIFLGVFVSVVATIGVIRLPDLYTRTHAASKGATLGILLVLLGVFFFFWIENNYPNGRLLLAIVFVFITGPVAGHLIGRAAYRTKVPLYKGTVHDDLKEKEKKASD
jgi:multicomponent Na+:H+ antiporter subunit G